MHPYVAGILKYDSLGRSSVNLCILIDASHIDCIEFAVVDRL